MPSKSIFVEVLDNLLLPIGLKRKGNKWMSSGQELTKIVHLQRSNFSNAYYINYGYIINGLALATAEHVSKRLSSSDQVEHSLITDVLNLENDIPDDVRANHLKTFINREIVAEMNATHTTADLLRVIKKLPLISAVPLNVRQFFELE